MPADGKDQYDRHKTQGIFIFYRIKYYIQGRILFGMQTARTNRRKKKRKKKSNNRIQRRGRACAYARIVLFPAKAML